MRRPAPKSLENQGRKKANLAEPAWLKAIRRAYHRSGREDPLPWIGASFKVPSEPEPRAGHKGVARLGFAEVPQKDEA